MLLSARGATDAESQHVLTASLLVVGSECVNGKESKITTLFL